MRQQDAILKTEAEKKMLKEIILEKDAEIAKRKIEVQEKEKEVFTLQ